MQRQGRDKLARFGIAELRHNQSATFNRVAYGKERIILQRHGSDFVAVVPLHDLAIIEMFEDEYWAAMADEV